MTPGVGVNQVNQNVDQINVAAIIDNTPLSGFQKWLMVLIGCSVVIDGFDVQAMGFVAPAIVRDWGINKAALGPVFGAGLLGMLIGSLLLSMLADRIGRRPVLIGATVFFGVCMLLTTLTTNLSQLLTMRLITGVGLGGIMANGVALVSEYSPKRRRVSLMMWVSCGFTGGAVLGGLVSALLIPLGGWKAVFIFGGVVPLLIAALMLRYLPESIQFLVLKQADLSRAHAWLKSIAPHLTINRDAQFVISETKQQGAPVAELFRNGRAAYTLLLWGINFTNLLNLFFLANWLPTLAISSGYSESTAVLIGTSLQVGGVMGTVAMGPLIDRFGFYKILVPSFLLAVFVIVLMGHTGLALSFLFVAVVIGGFCIVGGQPAVNALAATLYPTSLRATGVGWSLGVGRAGSIVGPVLAGHLIGLKWSTDALFMAAAVPALLSCLMLFWMSRLNKLK